jgi:DegV family protein with EDD domain
MDLDTLTKWVEDHRLNLCHWFTVDDLMYLKRGGRVSAATALVGTVLKIKPVLHVDDEGHLISKAKVRGRKASVDMLFDKAKELALPGKNPVMFICHGDCIEDAKYLESRVKEELGVQEVLIGYTGAVIGSHSGPGTLALFFLGEHR